MLEHATNLSLTVMVTSRHSAAAQSSSLDPAKLIVLHVVRRWETLVRVSCWVRAAADAQLLQRGNGAGQVVPFASRSRSEWH